MTWIRTFAERERIIVSLHLNVYSWYALLLEDRPSTFTATADAATDNFTSVGHDFVNGCRLKISSTGTLPGGTLANTAYRVINVSGNTFKICLESTYISSSATGTAVDITSAGTGVLTLTEEPVGLLDSFQVVVRKEILDYKGSGRRTLTFPPLSKDANGNPIVGPVQFGFSPTTGNISYRYMALAFNASSTRGNTAGTLVGIEDEEQTITITSSGKVFQYTASA